MYCWLLAFAIASEISLAAVSPNTLKLPLIPVAREPIDYSQRRGNPVTIKAVRKLKVLAGKDHQSRKNIVAIYVGLPIVDSSQDNVIIEDIKSKRANPQNMGLSLDGNTLWVEYIDVEPGFIDEITIRFSVDLYERRAMLTNSKPYDTNSALYQSYTRRPFYDGTTPPAESESSEFQLLKAAKILPTMDPVAKAKRIYNYLHRELSYGRPAKILSGGKPHCGNYADLFVRLCQTVGVPARRCAGFAFGVSPEDSHKTIVSGHNWAEFYLEGIGWIPVDPTIGDKNDRRKGYYFGSIDNARLCISKSGYHDQLPLLYKDSADSELVFTNDASSFKSFKYPDTIQGVHRFQYRFDSPIQISVPDPYGPSLTVLSRQNMFTKPVVKKRK